MGQFGVVANEVIVSRRDAGAGQKAERESGESSSPESHWFLFAPPAKACDTRCFSVRTDICTGESCISAPDASSIRPVDAARRPSLGPLQPA